MLLNTLSTASTSSVVAHFALTTVALSAGTASCSRSLHRRHERWLRHQSGRCWNKPSRCRTAGCRMSMGHLHRQCGPAEPKQNGHKSDRLLNAAGGGSLGTQAFSDIR